MPQLDVDLALIEKLVDQLSERDKIKLVRKLEAETLGARWKKFLAEIDRRRKGQPLTRRGIERMVEGIRQEIHERNRR